MAGIFEYHLHILIIPQGDILELTFILFNLETCLIADLLCTFLHKLNHFKLYIPETFSWLLLFGAVFIISGVKRGNLKIVLWKYGDWER